MISQNNTMDPEVQKKVFAIDLAITVTDTRVEVPSQSSTGIDRKLLRFKIHYFLLLAGLGAVAPFTAVFAQKSLGLSATSFAMAVMLQQFSSIFIKLLIGFAANFFKKLKVLIGVFAIGQVIFNLVLFEMPAVPSHSYNETAPYLPLNGLISYNWCNKRIDSIYTTYNPMRMINKANAKDMLFQKLSKSNECFPRAMNSSMLSAEMRMITIPPPCKTLPIFSNNATAVRGTTKQDDYPSSISNGTEEDYLSCLHNSSILCAIHLSGCMLCCSNISDYYHIGEKVTSEESSAEAEEVVDFYIQSDFQTYQFWLFALVLNVLYACTYSIFTLSDTACCESVQKMGKDFTQLKMCGPMAWGVMSVFGGFLSYHTGSFLAACIVLAIMTVLMLWNMSKLDLVNPTFSEKIFHDVNVVFSSKEFIAFEVGVLLNGIGHGIIWFYLIWFLTTMDGTLLLCGLVHTVQCLAGEVPFLFFSAWMVRKMGHFNATSLSLLAYSARFFWYSQLRNAWHVLPIEWTHGITFGVYYTTVTSFTRLKAKRGAEATTLAAVFTTFNGLGAGIGNILAGVCIDYFGGHRPFFYFGVAFGCFSLINVIYTIVTRNDNRIIIKIIPPPD